MKPRSATLFPVLLMLLLAGLTFWLQRVVELSEPPERQAPKHEPDFIVERFNMVRLSEEGKPLSSLTAEKMIHYPDDESTDITEPRLTQTSPNQPVIRVRADRGTVTKDGEVVHLYDNVVMTREAAKDRGPLEVETSYLEVIPEKEFARTPEQVVITELDSRLTGVGMEVNSKTREFELKSEVRGTLVPARKPGR